METKSKKRIGRKPGNKTPEASAALRHYLDYVPHCKHREVFAKILEVCDITPSLLQGWRRGDVGIPMIQQLRINKAFGQDIIPIIID